MKQKCIEYLKIVIMLFIITIIISIPYLNSKMVTTHDISYHINRIIRLGENLRMGDFPVLIHSYLLNGLRIC